MAIHHVALSVRNRDASSDWSETVLGLEEVFREDSPDRRVCVMRLPGGGSSVGVVAHVPQVHEVFDPCRGGLDHVAFTVGPLTNSTDGKRDEQRAVVLGTSHARRTRDAGERVSSFWRDRMPHFTVDMAPQAPPSATHTLAGQVQSLEPAAS